jgi:hypothetical protein
MTNIVKNYFRVLEVISSLNFELDFKSGIGRKPKMSDIEVFALIKKDKNLVFHYNMFGASEFNPILLRISLFPELTKIDFGYTTTERYDYGGWIKISPNTFIENATSKKRYTMTNAVGITLAPELRNFESIKDWQYFSLFFPAIPH